MDRVARLLVLRRQAMRRGVFADLGLRVDGPGLLRGDRRELLALLYRRAWRRRVLQIELLQVRLRLRRQQVRVRYAFANRGRFGVYHTIVPMMREHDEQQFFNYFRMYPATFDELLAEVEPYLRVRHVGGHVSPGEQLALTLRYLASGQHQISVAYAFLVAPSSVCKIVRRVCLALWDVLQDRVFRPLSEEMWEDVAETFEERWNFPNCIGALDGKHCQVQNFPAGGSDWFNYKSFYSMVLLGLADANYRFIYVDVGGRGRRSDGGLFRRSTLGRLFAEGALNLPPPRRPRNGEDVLPYVMVGDEAFSLQPNFMTPFGGRFLPDPQNIFKYRLSRAQRVVENAFGILLARWTILRRPIIASEETARAIIQATVCLHNFVLMSQDNLPPRQRQYVPRPYRDERRVEVQNAPADPPRAVRADAEEVREKFTDYFLGPGRIFSQWNHLRWIQQ